MRLFPEAFFFERAEAGDMKPRFHIATPFSASEVDLGADNQSDSRSAMTGVNEFSISVIPHSVKC